MIRDEIICKIRIYIPIAARKTQGADGIYFAFFVKMPNWSRVERIIGETAREIGVLVVVFAPLEATFSEAPINATRIVAMIVFGFLSIVYGIVLETRT